MPVDRSVTLSISQLSELIGIEPERFVGLEVDRPSSTITVVLEPKEEPTCGPDPTGHP
jgi:hypothetical protein